MGNFMVAPINLPALLDPCKQRKGPNVGEFFFHYRHCGVSSIHIGIDNLNVLRGVASLICKGEPLPFVNDGDLLATVDSMIKPRGSDTVNVSKVKEHAKQFIVDGGSVRQTTSLARMPLTKRPIQGN